MSERCELCGARWFSGDQSCRECGVSRFAEAKPAATPEPLVPTEAAPPAREAVPLRGRPRRVWLAAAAGLLASAGIGGYLATSGTPDEGSGKVDSGCQALEQLAGTWAFATEVTGSRSVEKLGMTGYYRLEVELDGCAAGARLTKTGFTGRDFSEKQIQRAEMPLQESNGAAGFGYGAIFELRDAQGRGPDQEFVFAADGDRIVGTWRQRGTRWEKSGLYGFLDGRRDAVAREIHPRLGEQPCDVRCSVACDAARRGDDAPADALQTCRSACTDSSSEIPACGDRRALPEDFVLALAGPEASLGAHCEAAGLDCTLDPKLGRRRAPSLSRKSLGGDWVEVHFAGVASPTDGEGDLRLALRTKGGWFLSEPVGDPSSPLTDADLFVRALGRGPEHLYIIGSLAGRTTDGAVEHVLACRLTDMTPRCVRVPVPPDASAEGAALVMPLPGDTLSIVAGDEPASDGRLASGLYGW